MSKPRRVRPLKNEFFYKDKWFYHDLDWNVVSVCVLSAKGKAPRKACALSAQGDVELQYVGGSEVEKISEAGSYKGLGAVKQIREIGDTLYVCGDQGQVYRRESPGHWAHIYKGILDRKISASALDLNSIDGISEDEIYVVGEHGKIFCRYDGIWHELDSPTSAHINQVRCASNGDVFACGQKGLVLKGNLDGFRDLSFVGTNESFWDVEVFQEKAYLACQDGIFVIEGDEVVPVSTGLEPAIGGYKLSANNDTLWSFGVDDLAYFDGNSWTRIIHPDNTDL